MSDGGDTVILHQELAYADALPLRLTVLDAAVDAATLVAWSERNLRLLHACAALEESAQSDAKDEAVQSPAELQRIDQKVNLLLEMVAMLVATSQARPPPRPLRFNAQALLWEPQGPPPAVQTLVCVEIYLRDAFVQPLVLTGVMQDAGTESLACIRFDPMPESVVDQIKRLVFRRHRRQIAVAKAARHD